MDSLEIVAALKAQLAELAHDDSSALDGLRRRSEMVIRNILGQDSKYLKDLADIRFYSMIHPASPGSEARAWRSGHASFENLLKTLEEELRLFAKPAPSYSKTKPSPVSNRDVFIVHGHDDAMKEAAARTLGKLLFNPVILHEQPSKGRTIIEKFEEYSNASFAVILLSPDDLVKLKSSEKDFGYRARQNVILELGFFLGKIGRSNVLVLYKQEQNFEIPSDYSGVLFVAYDTSGHWKMELAKELKAAGHEVDANLLLS